MVNIQQLDQQIMYLQSQLHGLPNPPATQQQAAIVGQLQAQLNQAYAQKQQLMMQQQAYNQMAFQQQPQMYQQPMYQQPQAPSHYGNYNANAGFAQPYNQPVQTRGYQTQVNHANTSRYGDRLKEMKETRMKEEQRYMGQVVQQQPQPEPVVTEPTWFPGHELGYLCSPNVMEKHEVENGLTKRELMNSGKNFPLDTLKIKRGKKEMNINTCIEDIYNLYPNEVRTHDAFDVVGVEKVYDILNYTDETEAVNEISNLLPKLDRDNISTFLSYIPKASKKFRRELDLRYTHIFNNLLKAKGINNINIDNLVSDVPEFVTYARTVENIRTREALNNVLDIVINDIKSKLAVSILEQGKDGTGILEIKFTGDLMVINNDNIGTIIKSQVGKDKNNMMAVSEESFPEASEALTSNLKPNEIKDVVAINGGQSTRYKLMQARNSVDKDTVYVSEFNKITHKEVADILEKIGL